MSPPWKATLAFLCFATSPTSWLSAQESEPRETLLQSDLEVVEGVAENFVHVDPAAAGWRTEVLHDGAKAGLKHLFAWIAKDKELPQELFADGFLSTEFRPEELETVFQDGALSVRQAHAIAERTYSSQELGQAAATLKAQFASGEQRDAFFKIITVEMQSSHVVQTQFLYHAAIAADPFVTQVNLEGVATWEIGADDEAVSMASLAVHHYEELVTSRPTFEDITTSVFGKTKRWKPEMMVGVDQLMNRNDRLIGMSFVGSQGIAVGDVNGDGLDDLYVAQQGGLPNRLYLHQADGTVVEAARDAQIDFLDNTRGVLLVDLDNDGDQDLVSTVRANLVLAYNNGKGVFAERKILRYNDVADIYSITAADPDGDGDLDLYACRYVTGGLVGGVPTPYHDAENGATNFYWRNEGNREWREVTNLVGLGQNNTKFSLGACWEDIDNDGDVDLYVANDFGRNNLYINDGHGQFKDEAVARGADDIGAAMGASIADVDDDGDLDILVTNMFSSAGRRIATQSDMFMDGEAQELHKDYVRHARGNTLLLNHGDGNFTDATETSGIAIGGWAWGAQFVDINNDGLEDIYSPNGFLTNTNSDDL
ncbi:MAG: FG-GAP repeat domain-containing protein [Planctomycetota bacterium]